MNTISTNNQNEFILWKNKGAWIKDTYINLQALGFPSMDICFFDRLKSSVLDSKKSYQELLKDRKLTTEEVLDLENEFHKFDDQKHSPFFAFISPEDFFCLIDLIPAETCVDLLPLPESIFSLSRKQSIYLYNPNFANFYQKRIQALFIEHPLLLISQDNSFQWLAATWKKIEVCQKIKNNFINSNNILPRLKRMNFETLKAESENIYQSNWQSVIKECYLTPHIRISDAFIRNLHYKITCNYSPCCSNESSYRRNEELVHTEKQLYPAPSSIVSTLMKQLITWINSQVELICFSHGAVQKNDENFLRCLTVAAISYQVFLTIHPFSDGNARTAAILVDILLLKFGLFPVILNTKPSDFSAKIVKEPIPIDSAMSEEQPTESAISTLIKCLNYTLKVANNRCL